MNCLFMLLLALVGGPRIEYDPGHGKLDDPGSLVIGSGKLDDPAPRVALSAASIPTGWPPHSLPPAMRPATHDRGASATVAKSEPCPLTGDPCRCHYAGHCRKADCPCPNKNLAAPKAAPAPRMWRLTDRYGQRWEHADPDWLMAWVARRNEATSPVVAAPAYGYSAYPASTGFGSACAGGSCSPSSSARGFRFFGR